MAAWAGPVPEIRQAGTAPRRRSCLCEVGSSRPRKARSLPAMVALGFDPPVKARGERLNDEGKTERALAGAARRPLLHIVSGVLESTEPSDPTFAAKTA